MVMDESWGIDPFDTATYVADTQVLIDEAPADETSAYPDRVLEAGRRALIEMHGYVMPSTTKTLMEAFARLDIWMTAGGSSPVDWESLHPQIVAASMAAAEEAIVAAAERAGR